ncbi:hypothetical protein ASG57_31885 [Bradyrhizobium sp. Leaf396]|nr:hypothetical protein ASG57_31885 [Bradyrhizobium sp. Leaf396]
MQRFEATLNGVHTFHGPGMNRAGEALEVLCTEARQLKEITEQPPGGVGDNDYSRLGDRLQSSRKVRRLADDTAFLRLSRPDKVANDDESRPDPDTHFQPPRRRCMEFCDGANQGKSRLHSMLGIMFVGLRVAEIHENAVAHIFGDETAMSFDDCSAGPVVCTDDLPQVLRIELRG